MATSSSHGAAPSSSAISTALPLSLIDDEAFQLAWDVASSQMEVGGIAERLALGTT